MRTFHKSHAALESSKGRNEEKSSSTIVAPLKVDDIFLSPTLTTTSFIGDRKLFGYLRSDTPKSEIDKCYRPQNESKDLVSDNYNKCQHGPILVTGESAFNNYVGMTKTKTRCNTKAYGKR